MQAQCQCGAVRIQIPSSQPDQVYVCHCLECRHQSSSAFGISAIFPRFKLPADLGKWSRPTASGRVLDCYFCRQCGARLVHSTEGNPTVSVKGGCLESMSKEMLAGAVHIWTKRAIVPIPEGVRTYPEEPDDD